ncbi:viral RNA helicase 1 [Alkalidesulfovibrio alkalitolerans DSM 16529]|uniref:DNA 3'-5' helicase II n=1 Tax=Alkalidesulfovibrio alkalitolerans DSM 16529 TaxID=1121439 RepID=S7T482_9BACT|nr:UvrD-helicase domain-containing protein [Alkalidesulfovibrio alkalitolerans]EPR31401.1 viral RNA helicase 1 [Alkalidesulfovibrio alkalitolerans DSM 16529]
MNKSRCIIAAAGSGKTRYIVSSALKVDRRKKILITSYTRENEKEIRKKFLKKNHTIPGNITIKTWWSFLFQHGVRPYQNLITDKPIQGLKLVSNKSGFRYTAKNGFTVYWGEADAENFYFSNSRQIYSDKIAMFVMRSDQAAGGAIFDRIAKIYDYIFIDEVQDLAGYDLDIVSNLMKRIPTLLVGDPRQVTYQTHLSSKYKKYQNGRFEQFIKDNCNKTCSVDHETLKGSYRCHQSICDYSGSLFPLLPQVKSLSEVRTDHDGVFFISLNEVDKYLLRFSATQLRYDRKTKVSDAYPSYNFGESKGLTFDRVVIYPTDSIKNFIAQGAQLSESTRCKYYVALTRARHSVAIAWDDPPPIDGINVFSLEE